jgi:hypothetical protein
MVKERCWRCNKLRSDVTLRASDDRLCEPCCQKNDEDLAAVRQRSNRKNNAATPKSGSASGATAVGRATCGSVNQRAKKGEDEASKTPVARGHEAAQSSDAEPHIQEDADALNSDGSGASDNLHSDCSLLARRVEQLALTVAQQKEVISMLTSQLDFVLSFLDIQRAAFIQPQPSYGNSVFDEANTAVTSGSDGTKSKSTTDTENIASHAASELLHHPVAAVSFADVVKRSVTREIADSRSSGDFATAMYLEQANKARRANSFLISGLPVSELSDKVLTENLCRDEFRLSVDVLSCKRIGRQFQDKPRNLLVYVRSREQAQDVISSAKLLRKSSNALVRTCVFVNPNLTKAEAKAQYELRQRRRRSNGEARREEIMPAESRVPDADGEHTTMSLTSDALNSSLDAPRPAVAAAAAAASGRPNDS